MGLNIDNVCHFIENSTHEIRNSTKIKKYLLDKIFCLLAFKLCSSFVYYKYK